MPRSLVSRSLEPLVAVLWSIFIAWTAWLAAVWIVPVGTEQLGFVIGSPVPPHEDLRRAILMLAENADPIWLALAVMNLHLVLTRTYGLRITRGWLALSAGSGLALGVLNAKTGMFFGKMQFGAALGPKLFGVALGWVFLWTLLIPAAREAVLWFRPRSSHRTVAILVAAVVLSTAVNIEWPVRSDRGWWFRPQDAAGTLGLPWQNWLSWAFWPGLVAFAMREKAVASTTIVRSGKPAFILAALNAIALAARLRMS